MTTIVDICNYALSELRADQITTIDDATPEGEACKLFYNRDRKEVLRSHPWNFAIKRSDAIAAEATGPTFGFNNYHNLPSDFLRLVTVHSSDVVDAFSNSSIMQPHYYAIEGQQIATNEEEIYLRYIYDLEDTTVFDNSFITALTYKLASSIALQITGNASLKSEMYNLFKLAISEAKSIDGQERPPTIIRRSRLVNSRNASYGRRYGSEYNGV